MTDVVRNADAVDLQIKSQIQSSCSTGHTQTNTRKCSDIFGSVNKIIQQFKVFQKLEARISTAHYNIQTIFLFACLLKKTLKNKKVTIEAYAVLKAEVVNSIWRTRIYLLYELLFKKRKESLELVEAKLKKNL